jgi:thioredoxin reductase
MSQVPCARVGRGTDPEPQEGGNILEDVVVIGGGPAGAACALWLHQLGQQVLLLESQDAIGGLQRRSPYTNRWLPGVLDQAGHEVAAALQRHLQAAGVPYRLGFQAERLGRARGGGFQVWGGGQVIGAAHVVLATGARPRAGGFADGGPVAIGPGAPMERLPVAGKRVAILGGGDNAFDQAAFVQARGAAAVHVYCRSAPRAQPLLRGRVPHEQVHVGPFVADAAGMTVNGRPYDLFGVQFGFEACVPPGLRLPLRDGCIVVDRHGAVPSVRGLHAAGEVTGFWHPCVATAYAHGIQVAKAIQQALDAPARAPGAAAARARPRGPAITPYSAAPPQSR